jgi:hypothetical protein
MAYITLTFDGERFVVSGTPAKSDYDNFVILGSRGRESRRDRTKQAGGSGGSTGRTQKLTPPNTLAA